MSGALVVEGIDRYVPEVQKLRERVLVLRGRALEHDPEATALRRRVEIPEARGDQKTETPERDPALAAGINYLTHFSARSAYNVYAFDAQGRRLIGSTPVREPYGRVVRTYESDAFFAFHHINAFERARDIFVDISAYADASIIYQSYMAHLLGPKGGAIAQGQFRRYRLPGRGTTAAYEVLTEESIELPRLHYERVNGRDYGFAYGVSRHKGHPDDFFNQLIKVNTYEGTASTWFEEGCYPGEPVFVAAPNATAEDAGIILSVVLDGCQQNSFLLLLDAQSWQEIARAVVPQHVPFGFHGLYTKQSC